MRLHRFYIEQPIENTRITINDPRLIHQWRNVFRMKNGDTIVLFDGRGNNFTCRIEELNRSETICFVIEKKKGFSPSRDIWLFVSLLKKDKLEWVLEKATELGVGHIVTILSERSENKNFNLERAKKIIIEAAEQSGRSILPTIHEVTTLNEALKNYKNISLFAFDLSGKTFEPIRENKKSIGFFIGPEGGWSEKEITLFKNKKIPLVSLGKLTLRAETAAVAAATLVSMR